jgi:hypothetical protein
MPIERGRSAAPISRAAFEARLRRWYELTNEVRVGDASPFGGAPWVWIQHGARRFHLNADATREGAGEYLAMLTREPELQWTVVRGRAGRLTKVVFGRMQQVIPGFYLYAKASPAESETDSHGEAVSTVGAEAVTGTALLHPRSPRRLAAGIESLLVGRTIGDRYEVAAVLGRGGMGVVYRARDERLGRDVAVKVIHVPNAAPEAQETLRGRFRREARSVARLRHPNVVTVFDYGTDDDLGLDYLVMELLEGGHGRTGAAGWSTPGVPWIADPRRSRQGNRGWSPRRADSPGRKAREPVPRERG